MSDQKSISNLAQLGILELFMFVLYKTIERESQRVLSGQGDGSVSVKAIKKYNTLAKKHGPAEFNDLRVISSLIDKRLKKLKINKSSATIFKQEIAGNFLTLRRDDKKEELAKRFLDEAIAQNDTDIARFLKALIKEEKIHDEKLKDAHFELCGQEEIPRSSLSDDDWRAFLSICFEIAFCGRAINDGCDFILAIAKREGKDQSDKALFEKLGGDGTCAYWSYC